MREFGSQEASGLSLVLIGSGGTHLLLYRYAAVHAPFLPGLLGLISWSVVAKFGEDSCALEGWCVGCIFDSGIEARTIRAAGRRRAKI